MDYYHISAEDLGRDARVPLVCAADSAEVFFDLALEMVSTIREHNARGEKTVFICPVGPVGHYPYLREAGQPTSASPSRTAGSSTWTSTWTTTTTWIDAAKPALLPRLHGAQRLRQDRPRAA